MRRLSLIFIALFLLFAMSAGVGAQENGWSGSLGSEATVYPYFADVSWFSLYLDYAGFTISSKTSLSWVQTGPGTYASPISVSQVFGLAFTWSWLTLGSNLSVGIFPFPPVFSSASIYGEATLFDAPLGDTPNGASFSGGLGASATVYPSLTDDVWFDLSLQVDGFSISSETTFSLMPFGFSEQRFDLGYGFDSLSVYIWAALSATWELSGGLGFYFSFP